MKNQIHAIQIPVARMQIVGMAFVHVFRNIRAILIQVVGLNVFLVMTAQETKPVLEINAWIHVLEHAARTLNATLLIMSRFVVALEVFPEMRSSIVHLL